MADEVVLKRGEDNVSVPLLYLSQMLTANYMPLIYGKRRLAERVLMPIGPLFGGMMEPVPTTPFESATV